MNEQNLTPRALTSEEARTIGQKGGIASGIARRQRRQLRELLSSCMTAEVTDTDVRDALVAAGYEPSFENALTLAALTRAAKGDVEALRFVRDTLGEKPTETYNLSMEAKPIKSMDLSQLSDAELERLADQADSGNMDLPAPETAELEALADMPDD